MIEPISFNLLIGSMMAGLSSPLQLAAIILLVAILPTLIGATPLAIIKPDRRRWLPSSLSVGIVMALFIDLILDGSLLGLNLDPRFQSATQLLLVGSFAFPLLLISLIDGRGSKGIQGLLTLYLVAIGIGLHSMAEGVVIGYELSLIGVSEEIGTLIQALSFALHKAGEGFVLSSLFFRGMSPHHVIFPPIVASSPAFIGGLIGLFGISGILGSTLFAAGAGASIFMLMKLLPSSLFNASPLKSSLGYLGGFLFIYSAGVMHSIPL